MTEAEQVRVLRKALRSIVKQAESIYTNDDGLVVLVEDMGEIAREALKAAGGER